MHSHALDSRTAVNQALARDSAQGSGARLLRLADGYTLSYQRFGNPGGFPVFYFHSAGSSRLECEFFHRSAIRKGYSLIAVDRPGIGWSDYRPHATPLDFARDVLQLADHLDIPRFGLLSLSTGGLFALAVAYLAPARVRFHLGLGGIPGNLAQRRSGSAASVTALFIGFALPLMIRAFARLRHSLTLSNPKRYLDRLHEVLSYTDRKALGDPRQMSILEAGLAESIRQGFQGVAMDTSLCFRDPGFRLEDIQVPVVIWQGRADRISRQTTADFVVNRIPRGSVHTVANRGHFFFLHSMDEIFSRARHLVPLTQVVRRQAA